MRRYGRIIPALALLLALGVALAACGEQPAGGFVEGEAAQKVEVEADPNGLLKWTRAEYRATAGDVSFVVKNPSPSRHNFVVKGNGVNATSAVFGRGARTYTLKGLPPGDYQIICTLPGHREAGMVARLSVE